MTHKAWTADFEDGSHIIQLEHGYFSGKKKISVDGFVIHESQNLLDTGGRYPVQIAGHACIVEIKTNGFQFFYDFRLADAVVPVPTTPAWVWLFVAGCVLIPILTLGGLIPALIGISGAATICLSMGRSNQWDTTARVIACVFVTIFSWALYFGLNFAGIFGRGIGR